MVLEIGMCIIGAVKAVLLGFILYKAYVRWAARRRKAVAHHSSVKKSRGYRLYNYAV
jgi:hypothetical protein